jgi:hypothetical protein
VDFTIFLGIDADSPSSGIENITGGRFQMAQRVIDQFLGFLVKKGAEIVFFVIGPVQRSRDDIRIEKLNDNYAVSLEVKILKIIQ